MSNLNSGKKIVHLAKTKHVSHRRDRNDTPYASSCNPQSWHPPARHPLPIPTEPRLLSIQFLVIRYLETISRVVLRVYTTLVIPWPACQPTHTLCSRKSNAFACGGVARVAGTRDRNNDDHLSSAPIQLRSLFFSSSSPFFLPRLVLLS